MSRPNGPVHHPGMPAQPEVPSDAHGAPVGGVDPNTQAGQQPQYGQVPAGQVPAGHAPQQQQPYQTPEQGQYGQNQNGQGYAPAQYQEQYQNAPQPTAPGNSTDPQINPGYDPAVGAGVSTWADVNQPVHQSNAQGHVDNTAVNQPVQQSTAQGHVDNTAYVAPQQQTPAYTTDVPAYDPMLAQPQQQAQAHYQQPAPPVQPTTPTAAPSGYDFAGYEAPQPMPQLDPGYQGQQESAVDWDQAGFAPVAGAGLPVQSGDLGFAAPAHGLEAGQQPVHADDGYVGEEDYEYEDEEETGRGRSALVTVALAGAIVIGGGMAYGYQSIFGVPSSDKPPIVKGASGPAKVKPADPGGRKFANTNSKILGRLGSASGKTNDPSGGARRVSTLRIGPDGSVVPPSNPGAGSAGNSVVTGLTFGGTPVATTGTTAAAKAPAVNKPLVVKPPAAKTAVKVVAAKPVPPKVAKPVAPKAAKPVAPKVAKPVAPAKKATPAVKTEAVAAPKKVAVAKPAPVAVGPKPTGAGYVAVLASVPVSKSSRMDSLKQFANMQQKYGTALANKTPDVQQANLGEKGTYHRLIAGPPGSAQSARQVCTSLKEAGYTSCWVLAY